jgi:hypothetical protein
VNGLCVSVGKPLGAVHGRLSACWAGAGRHRGQLHFQIGQRFASAFDELTQHGKLCGCFIAVRRIQRPAQPRNASRPMPASKAARTKHSRCKAASSNKP